MGKKLEVVKGTKTIRIKYIGDEIGRVKQTPN